MITIQIPEISQTDAVSRFIEDSRLSLNTSVNRTESMVLLEDGAVLGYAAYQRHEAEASVLTLFITPAMRRMGFGDGLLRALLNLMERNGIQRFFIPADTDTRKFLLTEDLIPVNETPSWVKAPVAEPFWFEGTLPEFFQKPCKGGRR